MKSERDRVARGAGNEISFIHNSIKNLANIKLTTWLAQFTRYLMGLGRQNFILVRTYSNCHQNRSTRRSRSSWKSDKVKGGRRKSGRINSSGDRQIMKLAINFRSKLAQLPGKPQKEYPPPPLLWPRPQRHRQKDAEMQRQRVGEWRWRWQRR